MKLVTVLLAMGIALSTSVASAGSVSVDLEPDSANPPSPQMGDTLSFHTVIRNADSGPVEGLIAWISLVEIDKDKEQPVDQEDWSAHKAVPLQRSHLARCLKPIGP
jgi:hypothetical protein